MINLLANVYIAMAFLTLAGSVRRFPQDTKTATGRDWIDLICWVIATIILFYLGAGVRG